MQPPSFTTAGHALANCTALVTGGTDGIGRAIALALAAHQCIVYVCGRSADKGSDTVAEAPSLLRFIQTDLTDPSACVDMIHQIEREAGQLDFLVNNAANDTRIKFKDATQGDFDAQININLRPMFTVTQAALPLLKAGQGKAIVNLATTNWMLGEVPFTLYSASKSGILGYSRALARELGADHIRVNVVSPGWIMTPKQLDRYVTEQDKQNLLRDQAIPRLMTADDVAPVVLFLLSPLAQGMTGQNLIVDGGKLMQ